MGRDIGIGMATKSALIRNLNAAENQLAAFHERMEIEALSNSNRHRDARSPMKAARCVDTINPRRQAWGIRRTEGSGRCRLLSKLRDSSSARFF